MEKRKFQISKNEEINLIYYPVRKFIAKTPPFGNIKIDDLFYEFNEKERLSIIYHELWHKKNNLKFELLILFSKKFYIVLTDIFRAFLFRGLLIPKLQEFEADKYAVKMNGKINTLNTLINVKKFVDDGILKEDKKNHPPLNERINKIKNMD